MNVSARQLVPLLLAAFVVGGLFRMHAATGIGFYRMFGTIGIVVMGWLATRIVQSWQLEDATAGMQNVLDKLPDGWQAMERGAPIGVLGWQGYLVGPDNTWAVTTLTTANYIKGRRLANQLRRGTARAIALAEVAPARLVVFPVHPCIVLLRRRADDEAKGCVPEDVHLFDVDSFAAFVETFPGAEDGVADGPGAEAGASGRTGPGDGSESAAADANFGDTAAATDAGEADDAEDDAEDGDGSELPGVAP